MARTTASAPKNPESVASSRSASSDCWIWSCSPSKSKLIPELTSCKVRRIACSTALNRQPGPHQHLHVALRVLVLRDREIGNGPGGAPDAAVFRILYQADDLVQLLRGSTEWPHARSALRSDLRPARASWRTPRSTTATRGDWLVSWSLKSRPATIGMRSVLK